MVIHSKKNDTSSRQKKEKPETTKLVVNRKKQFSKKIRRQIKKKNREAFKKKKIMQNKEGRVGDVWIWSGIDPESKYQFPDIVGTRSRVFGKRLVETIKTMRQNINEKLLVQSDDYDVYVGIIKECFADEVYSFFQNRDKQKVPMKVKMPDNILYTVLKKKRNSQGVVEEIEAKIIFGKPDEILKVLKDHNPTQGINTSYIERQNYNRRHFNARLRRKTMAFSKDYDCLVAQLNLQRIYANFCWPHHTLTKQQNVPTSPAMYIGSANVILEMKDIFFYAIYRH